MKKQTTILNLLAALCLCIVTPVQAENLALMELLKALQENGTIDEQTYELVKNVAQSESENEKKLVQEITRAEVKQLVDKAADRAVKGKVELASKELAKEKQEKSENSIRIGGRVRIDATTYRGIGAWQVAMRFSSLDLTDEDIIGGEEENFTLGLNWYATPNIRFAANYVNVLDVEGGINDGDEPESFQIRTQVKF